MEKIVNIHESSISTRPRFGFNIINIHETSISAKPRFGFKIVNIRETVFRILYVKLLPRGETMNNREPAFLII